MVVIPTDTLTTRPDDQLEGAPKRYDVVGFGETMLRLGPPDGGRLEDSRILDSHVAGAESNVLACASRLGLRCGWVSALPDNPLGKRVAGELRRHGVDTRRVVWAGSAARLGVFYAEEAPQPVGTRVYYDRAGSAISLLEPEAVDLSVCDATRVLHLSGITPALGPGARGAFSRLLERATKAGVDVSFDVNYRAKLWGAQEAARGIEEACRSASLIFCSQGDAAVLWGFVGGPESVLRRMEERFGSGKTMVLTLGGEGAAELREGRYDEAPPVPTEGRERFGSGDAFAAGYLYALLEGSGYVRAREEFGVNRLRFGNAVSALKRCIPGDIATVTLDEVMSVLRGKEVRFR